MSRPNLFDFATGELSQDAFLAWLARWADEKFKQEDPTLNETARRFLVELANHAFDTENIDTVESIKQLKRTDVIIFVKLKRPNVPSHLIVIEDKTSSGQHGNQLEKYKYEIEKLITNDKTYEDGKPHYIYYKTEDHITLELSGFRNFTRQQALGIFESERASEIRNNIFVDYVNRLRLIEDKSNAYKHLPTKSWEYAQWSGFFMALCTRLGNGANFGYVPNAQGGFIGAWFGWLTLPSMRDKDSVYLQIGGNKDKAPNFDLKLRVASPTKERTDQIRDNILEPMKIKLDEHGIAFSSRNIRRGRSSAIISFSNFKINDDANKVEKFAQDLEKLISILKS